MKCKKCKSEYVTYSASTVCCGFYLITGKPKVKKVKPK